VVRMKYKKGLSSNVIFLPYDKIEDSKRLSSFEIIMKYRNFNLLDTFSKGNLVGVKLYFGEDCDCNFIDPEFVSSTINMLRQRSVDPILCDTTNKYNNRFDNIYKHINTIRDNTDFTYDCSNVPFVMLDGVNGYSEVVRNTTQTTNYSEMATLSDHDQVYLAGELENMKGLIIFSRLTPHHRSGMQGAINNIGFGLASRKGKVRQHSVSKPQVDLDKCVLCGKCIYVCPVKAISIINKRIVIDGNKCIDCGKCVEYAYRGDISYQWNATQEHCQRTMASHALGVANMFSSKIIYCNFLTNFSNPDEKKGDTMNIGILFSKDPVAIDHASIELIKAYDKRLLPQMASRDVDYNIQLEYGEMIGLGTRQYKLTTIAY
jgi:uncharacterized protein